MNKQELKKIKQTFVKQLELTDCGVACLLSVIKYYGGDGSIEELRIKSGTNRTGTSLLGLYETAQNEGLNTEGVQSTIENLKNYKQPVILHVLKDNRLQHFMVCYGFIDDKFIVSDPAIGVVKMSEEEINTIWQSKALLKLDKGEQFVEKKQINKQKINWLLNIIKEDYGLLAIALLLGIITTGFGLANSVYVQKLIDIIIPSNDITKLTAGLVLLFILLLASRFISALRQYFLLRQSTGFNKRLINKFFDVLLYLPKLFFDGRKTGDLIARLNDTNRIQQTIITLTANLAIDLLTVILSVSLIVFYNSSIAGICLLALILIFYIVYRFSTTFNVAQTQLMTAYAANESNYIDTIQGIERIKSSVNEPFFLKRNKNIYGNYQDKHFNLGRVKIKLNLIIDLLSTFFYVGIISWCSFLVINNDLKLGEMMAIIGVLAGALPAIVRLGLAQVQIIGAKVAFERMFGYTLQKTENNNAKPNRFKEKIELLELKNIKFRFPGSRLLLNDVNLTIKKGELACLLGESGSGKSTIAQIIQLFYPISEGKIHINQTQLNTTNYAIRNKIACVSQNIKLFNGTLFYNIAQNDSKEEFNKVKQFCEYFGFNQYFEQFPQSYFCLLGEEGTKISGGQQQLVLLAAALYQNPELLILDEATSAMDRNMEEFVLNILDKIKQQMSILFITHRIKPALRSDLIYILEKGIISTKGKPKELLKSNNFLSNSLKDYSFM